MAKAIKKSKGLTDRQKATMKKHSVHHTSKHMNLMEKLMLSGKTFEQAHTIAQKQVGK
tara:strand:- start:1409 stop:1582 length:174 start_codon:yes stop_codon:yes gene_type:complete